MASDYICAGVQTLNNILENFYRDPHRGFNNHFTRADLSSFFGQTCNMFLHSFGQNLRKRKNMEGYADNEAKMLRGMKQGTIFSQSEIVVDSGGFQVSMGDLDLQQTRALIDIYHDFLVTHKNVYDRAFLLDLPPGQGGHPEFFKVYDDIYRWNYQSYTRAASLPIDVKRKLVYIHHFRTPALWDIFMKIMRDDNLFAEFEHHGTGGMVANLASDANTPCITYIIPLIPLLNEVKRNNRNYLHFHVLGIGNPRDIFFYEFFKTHVKKVHNIDLLISYDSAGAAFKQLNRARYILVYDGHNDMVVKMYVKTNNLDKRFGRNNMSVLDAYSNELNTMANKYGFKTLPLRSASDIYQDGGEGTFHDPVKIYSMLYSLESMKQIQEVAKQRSDSLYPLYEARQIEEFNRGVEMVTRKFNHERITRKQKAKTNSLVRSLDMLTTLDEDYCKYVVDRFLAKDEFIHLDPSCPLRF
jgi:hypothetical protein